MCKPKIKPPTPDEFDKHLKWASAVVATWPKWKRELLGKENSPAAFNLTVESEDKDV